MALNRWSLDRLILWGGTFSLLLLFLPIGLFLMVNYVDSVETNLIERGRSIARTTGSTILNPLLLNDRISVFEIINKTVSSEKEVIYISIENPKGDIVAHTFPEGFPRRLPEMRKNNNGPIFFFRTREGPLIEISEPIASGQLGHLYVGLSRERAVQAKYHFIWIMGLSLTGALIAIFTGAQVVAINVSKPLHQLECVFSEIPHKNIPDSLPGVSGTKEVESLKKVIREMIDRLTLLEHERAITQTHMIHAEKFAALGELAAGLTHEIRNPLDGMLECVRYLEAHPDEEAYRKKFLPMIREGLQRINKVMQHMLEYARSGEETTVEACRTSEIMDSLLPMLEGKLKANNVHLTWVKPGTCRCLSNKQVIMQILLNLVLNSIEALLQHPDPRIFIKAYCDAQWVYISIEDNGPGIDEKHRDKIFDPFFTTRPKGEGTGLGLAISRELIRSIGGELEFSPEPQVLTGARFVLRVPRVM